MALRDDLMAVTPRLRRYARALVTTASNPAAVADDLVHATLLRALDDLAAHPSRDVFSAAYGLLTDAHREMVQGHRAMDAAAFGAGGGLGPDTLREPRRDGLPGSLADGLARLRLDEREALLLVAVEGLSHAESARILRISPATLIARLGRARAALAMAGFAEPRRRDHLRLVQ